jgi:hypothetical protein
MCDNKGYIFVYGQSALNNTAVLYDKNSESEYLNL